MKMGNDGTLNTIYGVAKSFAEARGVNGEKGYYIMMTPTTMNDLGKQKFWRGGKVVFAVITDNEIIREAT